MIDLSQHQRVSVLVLGGTASDLEQLQVALPYPSIQWQQIQQRDLDCLLDNMSPFDCIFVRTEASADELGNIAILRQHNAVLPIIAIGNNWQVPAVVQAMKFGATEVCEFHGNLPELRCAFERSLSTDSRTPARYTDVIPKALLAKLTSEEARILHLLVQGRTTKEVGATLDVSIRTVHYRKKELLRKLGVQNRSEAIELIRLSTGGYFAIDASITAL